MHHNCIHAVRHGEGLEVRLDGHREGQFVNEVHWCARDDGTAAQILEAEDCITRQNKKREKRSFTTQPGKKTS